MRRVPALLLLATVIVGCTPNNPEPAKVPLSQAPAATTAAPPAVSGELTGAILEQLNASPYVYLRLKTSKGDVWTAVPEAKVATGAQVTVFNPMLMTGFASKSLKRTFDEIYFGTLTPAGEAPAAAGGNPHAAVAQSAAPVNVGKVEKASGADARTVSEVWADKAALVGKSVTIRGVVVKYNDNVMGKNWIHLQDGSGDAMKGTNDITVTSLGAAAKGETVTITGTVRTNKDFGAGYSYAVIVEDAKVVRK